MTGDEPRTWLDTYSVSQKEVTSTKTQQANINFQGTMAESNESSETIISNYKMMTADCQQIAAKIAELNLDRDEHKLVMDTLKKLAPERKAFRLVGGVLVERTVANAIPEVTVNYESILEIVQKLEATLKTKDEERRQYKEKHGIMTQEERDQILKQQAARSKKPRKRCDMATDCFQHCFYSYHRHCYSCRCSCRCVALVE